MSKINWKVRLKNPVFWTTLAPIAVGFVYSVASLLGITPSISEDNVVNVIVTVVTGIGMFAGVIDPTTKGVGDSSQALTYDTPKES